MEEPRRLPTGSRRSRWTPIPHGTLRRDHRPNAGEHFSAPMGNSAIALVPHAHDVGDPGPGVSALEQALATKPRETDERTTRERKRIRSVYSTNVPKRKTKSATGRRFERRGRAMGTHQGGA